MKQEMRLSDYEPPKVEIIEVEVEKGFALSEQNLNPTQIPW